MNALEKKVEHHRQSVLENNHVRFRLHRKNGQQTCFNRQRMEDALVVSDYCAPTWTLDDFDIGRRLVTSLIFTCAALL